MQDIKDGSEFWPTQIPKKALKIIKDAGYDGIKDIGGKTGGPTHAVWQAFEPRQIYNALTGKLFSMKKTQRTMA